MKRQPCVVLAAAFLLAIWSPGPASAQLWEASPPGEDTFTFSLNFGMLSPQTEYSDSESSTFESGGGIGATGTYWPLANLGIRAHVLRAETDGVGTPAIEVNDPTQWVYGLEAVLRYPMQLGDIDWFPYLAGGPGAKSYRWENYQPARAGAHRDSDFAWTYGGGIEARFGIFGIVADLRAASSDFVWFGLDEPQSDFLFTGGVTLSY